MGLRDKSKDIDGTRARRATNNGNHDDATPEFIFVRSDTNDMEIIQLGGDHSARNHDTVHSTPPPPPPPPAAPPSPPPAKEPGGTLRRSLSIFQSSRSRSKSDLSQASIRSPSKKEAQSGGRRRRLSERLHLRHQPESSDSVPPNLPVIVTPTGSNPDPRIKDVVESQWEQRATLLAGQNELARSAPGSPTGRYHQPGMPNLDRLAIIGTAGTATATSSGSSGTNSRSRSPSATRPVSSKAIDDDIQEAIRLHEEGDLQRSTHIFGRLADFNGANNPLSQVLYGLALRHGWGCAPDTEKAVKYLSAAASNAAAVEEMALRAGMKKGGAAKGELILAIFELANCFRHGWGITRDAVAAKQYYETAANLGDTDAMNEAAWCYLEGFGCKKDKFTAAQYLRLAENAGNKTLGNSWIWKEKYNPGKGKGKRKS